MSNKISFRESWHLPNSNVCIAKKKEQKMKKDYARRDFHSYMLSHAEILCDNFLFYTTCEMTIMVFGIIFNAYTPFLFWKCACVQPQKPPTYSNCQHIPCVAFRTMSFFIFFFFFLLLLLFKCFSAFVCLWFSLFAHGFFVSLNFCVSVFGFTL